MPKVVLEKQEPVLIPSLRKSVGGVTLQIHNTDNGKTYQILDIREDGIHLHKRISKKSGIPVENGGMVKIHRPKSEGQELIESLDLGET